MSSAVVTDQKPASSGYSVIAASSAPGTPRAALEQLVRRPVLPQLSQHGRPRAGLDAPRSGRGPLVVLVHGSVLGASVTWRKQQPLAQHWTLCTPNRPGFGDSAPNDRGDFEAEAPLIADLLGDGAHLVGHSYGAVIAMFAAALRPDAVRSLTLSEPGSLGVAAGNPAVDAMLASGSELFRRGHEMDPRELLVFFRSGAGSARATPDELDDDLLAGARLLMREPAAVGTRPAPGATRPSALPQARDLGRTLGGVRGRVRRRGGGLGRGARRDPGARALDTRHGRALQRAAARVSHSVRGRAPLSGCRAAFYAASLTPPNRSKRNASRSGSGRS
jgi:pimeloyl-ACP methyl ester carboxylesterase